MITKKIKTMMFIDWDMWVVLTKFMDFLDPVIKHNKEKYKIEMGKIIVKPMLCGSDLSDEADFIIDRCSHWNGYYKSWAHSAINSGINIVNNSQTNSNMDKQNCYDLLSRTMHPEDRHPTTVLLPEFSPYTDEQKANYWWREEEILKIKNTHNGFDPDRAWTDWKKFEEKLNRHKQIHGKIQEIRASFYEKGNYLKEAVDKYFNGQFPIYLKKAYGGGGSDVYKIHNMEELYKQYDDTKGGTFHLQESIEDFDIFIRSMAIGPQILPMKYQPDAPIHQHYSEDKIRMNKDIYERMYNYIALINSYHRWTYNTFEALLKNGQIHPIDCANACPDSFFYSLHAHFPWLICALVKWCTFCAVTGKDLKPDMEQRRYQEVINDPKVPQIEKYNFCAKLSREYFEIEKFQEFCDNNFKDIDERMVDFYDRNIDEIIKTSIHYSDFPVEEHGKFRHYYKSMMERTFRKNPKEYLTTVIFD